MVNKAYKTPADPPPVYVPSPAAPLSNPILPGGSGITGMATRYLNTLFGNDSSPYLQFLKLLLQSANSVPVQALWILWFDSLPMLTSSGGGLATQIRNFTNIFSSSLAEGDQKYKDLAEAEPNYNTGANTDIFGVIGRTANSIQGAPGAIFAQGVIIPPEALDANRDFPPNSGFIKPLYSSGRQPFSPLQVSFLETNYSFTDYCLRPWVILNSIYGIKTGFLDLKSFKTHIHVMQFIKTPDGFKERKGFTFYNAFPITIDQEDYSYAGDKVIQRQVGFAYDNYILSTPEVVGENLVEQLLQLPGVSRILNPIVDQVEALKSKFSAENVRNFATDLTAEAVGRVVGSVASNVGDQINTLVSRATTEAQNVSREAEVKTANQVNEQIDKMHLFSENLHLDTPSSISKLTGSTVSTIIGRTEDAIAGAVASIKDSVVGKTDEAQGQAELSADKNQEVIIDPDDTPKHTSGEKTTKGNFGNVASSKQSVNTSSLHGDMKTKEDVAAGREASRLATTRDFSPATGAVGKALASASNIKVQLVTVNRDDTPVHLTMDNTSKVKAGTRAASTVDSIITRTEGVVAGNVASSRSTVLGKTGEGQDQAVAYSQGMAMDTKDGSKDTPTGKQIPFQEVVVNRNDKISAKQLVTQEVVVNQNDQINAKQLQVQEVIVNQNDQITAKQLSTQEVVVNQNDKINAKQLPIQQVTIDQNDSPRHG